MSNSSLVLQAQNLSRQFVDGKRTISVLDQVNFSLQPGEKVAVVGASGSGKSTLLHLLGGLDSPTSGTVEIDGAPISTMNESERSRLRNRALGFIYQFHHLLGEFSALENVAMPLLVRRENHKSALQTASEMLEKVGLKDRLDHKPYALSGGERQRAAIARALVTRPRCVLADEPTGNLDRESAEQAYDLMLQLNREAGTALVLVTHDLQLAEKMDRIEQLVDGRLAKS